MESFERAARRIASRVEAALAALESSVVARGVLFCGLLILMAASVFLLNVNTPLILDDYDFMISWATGERLSGFADVIRSQIVHYQIWGGRLLHVFTQSFLYLGKDVFNAANTAVFLLLLLEVYSIAAPKRRFCWTILLAEYLALMTMVPFFGTVFLWLTGSCIYLWGTAFALLPFVAAKSIAQEGWLSRGRWRALLCLPIGILAGWTNENTTCGMIAVVLVWMVCEYLRVKRVRGRMMLLFAGQCIGAALLLFAPGNFSRASVYTYDSMLMELLRRFIAVTAYGVMYLGILLAAILLLGAGLREKVRRVGRVLLLLFGALISVYAMVGSPELSDRTYTGAFMLTLAALLTLLGDAEESVRKLDGAKIAALPLLLAAAVYVSYHAVGDVEMYAAQWNTQIAAVEQAVERRETQVEIESVQSASRFTMDIELQQNASEWPNSSLSKVYGVSVYGK